MTYFRTVYFSDTDAAGVVYFASVLSMCHEAYEASLAAVGINLKTFFRNPEVAIPITQAEIDFYRPLFCGDRVTIPLNALPLSESEFQVTYQVLCATSADTCFATAKTRHVCINPALRRRIPLPELMQQWLDGMRGGLGDAY